MSLLPLCVVLLQIIVQGETRPCCSGKGDGLSLKQDAHPLKHQEGPSSLKHTDEAQKLVKIPDTGVFAPDADEEKTITVMEGDSVTLRTNLTQIQEDDQILWMLKMNNKDICVAEVHMRYNKSSIYDDIDNGRFRGKLKLDSQTGSLTIANMRITDSGVYTLEIINSGGTLYARFRVIVSRLPVPVIGRNASQNASSESSESGPASIGLHYNAVIIILVAAVVFIPAAFAVITFQCDNQAGQEVEGTEMKPMNNNDKAHDGDGVSAPLAASNGVSHECSVPVAETPDGSEDLKKCYERL